MNHLVKAPPSEEDERQRQIVVDYQGGYTMRGLLAKHGISREQLARILKAHGVTRRARSTRGVARDDMHRRLTTHEIVAYVLERGCATLREIAFATNQSARLVAPSCVVAICSSKRRVQRRRGGAS